MNQDYMRRWRCRPCFCMTRVDHVGMSWTKSCCKHVTCDLTCIVKGSPKNNWNTWIIDSWFEIQHPLPNQGFASIFSVLRWYKQGHWDTLPSRVSTTVGSKKQTTSFRQFCFESVHAEFQNSLMGFTSTCRVICHCKVPFCLRFGSFLFVHWHGFLMAGRFSVLNISKCRPFTEHRVW